MVENLQSTKYYSSIQEKRLASALGWQTVSGSGSRACRPGDIHSSIWLGECKTHTESNKNIQFKFSVWNKIRDEAISQFKYPVLFVDDGSQLPAKTWCMTSVFQEPTLHSDIQYIEYPYKVLKSGISFNHDDMLDILRSGIAQEPCRILVVLDSKHKFYIYRFLDFLDLYGDTR